MRLTTELRVQAYLRRLAAQDIPAFVLGRGDPQAGAVMVKLNTLDGKAQIFERVASLEGDSRWTPRADAPLTEAEADAILARVADYDPDLWRIEVEDRRGRHGLEDGLL